MSRIISALLVLLVGLVCASLADPRLAKLCNNKEVQLETVDDLKAIAKEAESSPGECSRLVLDALRDMNEIVRVEQACTMEKADSITKFVGKYLKKSAGGESVGKSGLPKSLAAFAISYGFQVSGVCSREMMQRFGRDASARIHEKLSSVDHEKFERFREHLIHESPLGILLRPIVKAGEVILPLDLSQLIPEARSIEVKLPENENSDWIKGLCANTLRPMYAPILLPLAYLIRTGFNNAARYKKTADKENGLFWSATVFLCETLNSVKLEDDNQAEIDSELQDGAKDLANSEELKGEDEFVQPVANVRFEYESDGRVSGEIVSPSISSLVKAFDANKNEVDHLRDRLMSRSLRVLRALFNKKHRKSMFKDFVKMVKVRGDKDSPEFDKVRASIEELISSNEGQSRDLTASLKSKNSLVGEHEHKSLALGWAVLIIVVGCIAFGAVADLSSRLIKMILNHHYNKQEKKLAQSL